MILFNECIAHCSHFRMTAIHLIDITVYSKNEKHFFGPHCLLFVIVLYTNISSSFLFCSTEHYYVWFTINEFQMKERATEKKEQQLKLPNCTSTENVKKTTTWIKMKKTRKLVVCARWAMSFIDWIENSDRHNQIELSAIAFLSQVGCASTNTSHVHFNIFIFLFQLRSSISVGLHVRPVCWFNWTWKDV